MYGRQSHSVGNRTDEEPEASCATAIAVAGLWKHYGVPAAVCGVSFEVGAGRIFGLLGANGAGKTTTLECILGLRQADSGSIRLNGLDLRTHAAPVKRQVDAQLQAATLQVAALREAIRLRPKHAEALTLLQQLER